MNADLQNIINKLKNFTKTQIKMPFKNTKKHEPNMTCMQNGYKWLAYWKVSTSYSQYTIQE